MRNREIIKGTVKILCMCAALCVTSSSCSPREMGETEGLREKEKTKITITWWGSQSRHAYMQELLEEYTKIHEDVEFDVVPTDWEGYFDKLSIQAVSGSMPDIVQMDYMYIETYARNGSLADLQPFLDEGIIHTEDIDDIYLDSGSVEGKLAGIALGSAALTVSYNADVFQKTGVEPPSDEWTWEDYIEKNQAISQKMGSESAQVEVGATGDINIFNYWVRQHGEALFNEEKTGLGFEDDGITAGYFQMWKDMMDEDISPDPDETSDILTRGQDQGAVLTGEAGTVFEWSNYAVKMSGVNGSMKLALPPLLEGSEKQGLWVKPSMFFSISENSKVKEACAEFIDWFINSEQANNIIRAERGVPISSAVREQMIQTGILSEQEVEMFQYIEKAEKISGALPAPEPTGISEINEEFNRVGTAVFYEQMTAEDGAKEFRAAVERILSGKEERQ